LGGAVAAGALRPGFWCCCDVKSGNVWKIAAEPGDMGAAGLAGQGGESTVHAARCLPKARRRLTLGDAVVVP
jgi:hypothetical protein